MTLKDAAGLDAVIAEAVASGRVPHLAVVVGDRAGTLYEGGAGSAVPGVAGPEVGADTPFRIMSMTKMVVTVAALQLVEQGLLDLDTPVGDLVPAFDEVRVLDGFTETAGGGAVVPVLRAPATRATVRHLLNHTTGLGYWFWSEDLKRFEEVTGTPNVVPGDLAAFGAPMICDPGTAFVYGINTDWLGRVLEAVTGVGLDVLVERAITTPLGMAATTFAPDDATRERLVPVCVPGPDGGWVSAGEILNPTPQWWAGGHGLYSTPRDYLRFQRMLLCGGELDGVRVLSAATVDEAFSDQLGGLPFPEVVPTADPPISDTVVLGPDQTWGHGLLINRHDIPGRRRAGTGAWAGLFNTHFFVDRTAGICVSLYTNSLPFAQADGAWRVYQDVEEAVYAAL